MKTSRLVCALLGLALAGGCSGFSSNPRPAAFHLSTPVSTSPALIPPAPMAHTAILPASSMAVKLQSAIPAANWTQIPGVASSAAAAPDGSLWVLSTAPAGNDKYIWHYANGGWTNISGLASRLSVAPNGTLYAINSGGGTFSYSGGTWTALGGGASDVTVAVDGSIYVLSNGNAAGSDQAIWHYTSGWSQVPGSGVKIAASWDTNSYTLSVGTVAPGGLYILNSIGNIYHENTDNTFVQLPGNASAIAPTTIGGIIVLGYPANANGNSIYYYDLSGPGWSTQSGSGVSISTDSAHLYVIGASGGIYSSPITSKLNAAQINTALQSVATYYGTLSHGDAASDTQKVMQFIATQSAFTSATVVPGGISAQLSDGTPTVFYTDHFHDEVTGTSNAPFTNRSGVLSSRHAAAAPAHSIVFLVNDSGDPAFVPDLQKALAAAFNAAYPAGQYAAASGSISLANLVSLSSESIDVLGLATHGIVDERVSPARFMWESTTPVTDQNLATYASLDYKKTIFPSEVLDPHNPSGEVPTFSFTADFLAEHVHFTPGAIVLNSACFGQYVNTANDVSSKLFAAGVGAYMGWTKEVVGIDADETDAFFSDRLLGEQSPTATGLSGIITQRTPPQRPFSLTEVYAQMLAEKRNDPAIQKFRDPPSPAGETLATSTDATDPDGAASENWSIAPMSDGPVARWVLTTSNAINGFPIPSAGVIEFGGPSIAYMTVDETTTPATLTINGEFPATQGQVTMSASSSSPSGGSALTVTSWTQTAITAQLADEGSTAAGYVTVTAGGVPSNPVPLTQWSGTLKVSETDQITSGPFDTPPYAISGSGNVQATFTIHFRADVHSFYGSPDVALDPTNFAFTPEKDSTGTWGPINGSATISQPSYNLTFSVGSSTTLKTQNPGGSNFALGSILSGNGSQHGCNGGGQGPTDTLSYWAISCIAFSASQPNGDKVSCSDSMGGNVCMNEIGTMNPLSENGGFDTTQYGVLDAIHFVLDSNYNVSAITNIPATDPNPSNLFRVKSSSTSYTFSFGAPVAPPIQGMTPASTQRRLSH